MRAKEVNIGELLLTKPAPVLFESTVRFKELAEAVLDRNEDFVMVENSLLPGTCAAVLSRYDVVDHLITFIHKEGMGRTEEEFNQMIKEKLNDSVADWLAAKDPTPPPKFDQATTTVDKVSQAVLFLNSVQTYRVAVEWRCERVPKVHSKTKNKQTKAID